MTTPGSSAVSQGSDDVAYLCRLPRIFRGGTESARNLVHKSRTNPKLITVEAVKAALDADPGLIDDWQRWSEDKRISSGAQSQQTAGSKERQQSLLEFPQCPMQTNLR